MTTWQPQRQETIPATSVKHGDCILINGTWQTVSRKYIFQSTLARDYVTVNGVTEKSFERALFPKWYKGDIIAWVSQF